jgi:phosphohistidine phosphatase SixA
MRLPMFVLAAGLALLTNGAFAQPAQPFKGFNPTPNDFKDKAGLAQELRRGGYVIFFRHAITDRTQTDSDRQNLATCATQRNLSEAGRAQSRSFGDSLRKLDIPVGDVVSSPYCRTLETARLAFGRTDENVALRHLFPEDSNNFEIVGSRLRPLLSAAPRAGCNTVIVSHGFNFRAVHGFDPGEGEAAVLRPDGRGQHAYVGRLTSEDLEALAATPPAPQSPASQC